MSGLNPEYKDRAAARRKKYPGLDIGVYEKFVYPVVSAGEHEPLPVENKGYQLLQAMGWTGKGLGKNQQGMLTPLAIKPLEGKAGLGTDKKINSSEKEKLWMKARLRYENTNTET